MQHPLEKPRDLWTDDEFIEAYGRIAQMNERPYCVGKIRRPSWTGRIRTYVIWCSPCRVRRNKGFTVAHFAGFEKRLECGSCRARHDQFLPSRRIKDTLLNPHRHPWFIAFLMLAAVLTALAAR